MGSDLLVNTAAAAAEQTLMEFAQPSTIWPSMSRSDAALTGQQPSSDATSGSHWMQQMWSNQLVLAAIAANQTQPQVP